MLVSDAGSGVAAVAELWRIEFLAVPCAASVVELWRREFVAVPCAYAGTPTQGQPARCATVATTKLATYNVGAKEDRMHLAKKNDFLDKLLKDTRTILDQDCAVDITMHMATT